MAVLGGKGRGRREEKLLGVLFAWGFFSYEILGEKQKIQCLDYVRRGQRIYTSTISKTATNYKMYLVLFPKFLQLLLICFHGIC